VKWEGFMNPLEYYQQKCEAGSIVPDQQQLMVLTVLHKIDLAVQDEARKRNSKWRLWHKRTAVQGLYVWGSVGIGKTFLMDCFFHCLPMKNKWRIHFHRFMQHIHQELKQYQGVKNPLQRIANNIANKAMVLCFDELIVTDIVDAMILARLFKALYAEGVTIVLTSNTAPDDLYKRGLQRDQFLPAILLLKQHSTVIHVPTAIDYRLRFLKNAGVFYAPDDHIALENMQHTFSALTHGKEVTSLPIEIESRLIRVIKRTDDVIWFDFSVICNVPRSQHDYLRLAAMFKTVLISHIPMIKEDQHNFITLFIRLVDVFYDAGVRLVLSAEKSVDQLYVSGRLLPDYARTQSRLIEMQSEAYYLRD
jgi:cell division protein ZapE